MIRTEDTVLFNLHAYLGYLLHRNAVGKNVRSLFPTNEFEELVCNFLRLKDDISASTTIKQRAALMVEEARTRLVLLVEPEPGFFGFELRSLQEFFAGAYLVQTANGTQQRFDRLRAIALSEHWRNVTLFCAGRIVRDYSGEAFKILEDVCRPIDRDSPDTYLRRGAQLALDVAADGIFTMSNRNLQHSAVELSLTVLQTGITLQGQNHLTRAFQRLSSEDRHDILSKLLKQRLASLPLSCLPTALMNLGGFIESKDLIRVLEVLLTTNKQEYILPAIQIGFRHGIETQWLARQIEKYWHLWTNSQLPLTLHGWWSQDQERTQKIFLTLSLTEDQASNIMDRLLLSFYDEPFRVSRFDFKLMENPRTYSEQIVVFLQCWSIIHRLLYRTNFISIELRSIKVRQLEIEGLKDRIDEVFSSSLLVALDQLMERSDLILQLRACLWFIYWQTHEPTESMVAAFLTESRSWAKNQSLSEFVLDGGFHFRFFLLALAMESQINNDQHTLALLQRYLVPPEEALFRQQISAALQKGLDNLSREAQFATVLCCNYTVDQFPELVSIAEKLGIDSSRLIEKYTGLIVNGNIKLPSSIFREIFLIIEKSLVQLQNFRIQWWPLLISKWELDHETTRQGVNLLPTLIERLPQQPAIFEAAVILFLKLLCFDNAPLLLAPTLLSAIADSIQLKDLPMWELTRILLDIPEERLIHLANFTSHDDPKVQQGALALWAGLVEAISEPPYINNRLLRKTKFLRFNWELGLYLIKDADLSQRRKGIMLLIYSRFPIEMRYLKELGNAIAQAQDSEEIEAWDTFLRNIPISRNERKTWQKWLETLLDAPQSYRSSILTTVMERYTELAGNAGPGIKDERALGLPVLAPSKAERARS